MQLDKKALGLALGIPCGIAMLLATLWAWFNHGGEHLGLLTRFYPWYRISPFGAVLGLIYGFIYGFVGGWVVAWLYNRLAKSP